MTLEEERQLVILRKAMKEMSVMDQLTVEQYRQKIHHMFELNGRPALFAMAIVSLEVDMENY